MTSPKNTAKTTPAGAGGGTSTTDHRPAPPAPTFNGYANSMRCWPFSYVEGHFCILQVASIGEFRHCPFVQQGPAPLRELLLWMADGTGWFALIADVGASRITDSSVPDAVT